jgi:hypothetical protein
MNKRVLTTIEIEAFAPSSSTAPDERGRPISHEGRDCPSKPEPRRRAALRWFIDSLAIAGAGMAGVHVGVWLDPPADSDDPTSRKDKSDWKTEATE